VQHLRLEIDPLRGRSIQ